MSMSVQSVSKSARDATTDTRTVTMQVDEGTGDSGSAADSEHIQGQLNAGGVAGGRTVDFESVVAASTARDVDVDGVDTEAEASSISAVATVSDNSFHSSPRERLAAMRENGERAKGWA